MKKGIASLDFTIGLIIFIIIFSIILTLGIKFLQTTIQTKSDFQEMNAELLSLEDGEQGSKVFRLKESYRLVSFAGEDLRVKCTGSGRESITIPPICKETSCLCICRQGWTDTKKVGDCIKRGVCQQFDYAFFSPDSNGQVCIDGPTGGLIELFFKKENNRVTISRQSSFTTDENIKPSEDFNEILNKLIECGEDDNCVCDFPLDSFIEDGYFLMFENEKKQASLIQHIEDENEIETIQILDFDIKIIPPEGIFNNQLIIGVYNDPVDVGQSLVVYEGKDSLGSEGFIEVSTSLVKSTEGFTLLPSTETSDLPICGVEQLELETKDS